MLRWLPAILLLLGSLAPLNGAWAAVFAGITYSGSGDPADLRRLDMHTPSTPGPHPVVAILSADADTSGVALSDDGHVVAVVRVRADSATDDLLTALLWLWRHASSYGGDARRMHLVAAGEFADAALQAVAQRAVLQAAGMPQSALRGVALRTPGDKKLAGVSAGSIDLPALLVVPDPETSGQRAVATALVEQWRNDGAPAESIPASGAAAVSAIKGWLAAQEIERVPRFETMLGRLDTGWPDHDPGPDAMVAAGSQIVAASGGKRVRTYALSSPGEAWKPELIAAGGTVLALEAQVWPGAQVQVGMLVVASGKLRLWTRAPASARWQITAELGDAPAGARAGWMVVADFSDGGRGLLIAVDAGENSRIFRIEHNAAVYSEAVATDERVTGLAMLNGIPHASLLGGQGRIVRRSDSRFGLWTTVAAWARSLGPLLGLSALGSGADDGLIGILGESQAVRIDPQRGRMDVEVDLAVAFAALNEDRSDTTVRLSTRNFSAVYHPHSGDRVHLAGILLGNSQRPLILLRQDGGYYSYGRLDTAASGAATSVAASPFVADAGAVVHFAIENSPPLRAVLPPPTVATGYWLDTDDPAHAVVLYRNPGGWLSIHMDLAPDGSTRWLSAVGSIVDQKLHSESGLLRHHRGPDGMLHAISLGSISMAFADQVGDRECVALSKRSQQRVAQLQTTIDGVTRNSCLTPQLALDAGRPRVNGSGIWIGPEGAWGLAVQSSGFGVDGPELATLIYFGAGGEPNWIRASGERRDGFTALNLSQQGVLSYRFSGNCARIDGSASVRLAIAADRLELRQRAVPLSRAAGGACY